MIKIICVEINGFIILSQKIKLDFVESNIVCIYGDNGSGKTSFLEILFAVFNRDEKILAQYNVEEVMITYIIDKPEIKNQINGSQSNIIDNLENEVELFRQIQYFLHEYNSFLNYDKELVINANGVFVAPNNHPLQKLSSGERHLLTFLATILLTGEEKDFILIDEPEISLNVDWQRKILSTIAKLAPNSQIIIATHSPLVARGYKKSVNSYEKVLLNR